MRIAALDDLLKTIVEKFGVGTILTHDDAWTGDVEGDGDFVFGIGFDTRDVDMAEKGFLEFWL